MSEFEYTPGYEDVVLYDSLPRSIRDVIKDYPATKHQIMSIFVAFRTHGEEEGLRQAREMLERARRDPLLGS